jgi:hypothetical protein
MTAFTTVDVSVGTPLADLAAQLVAVANGDTCEVSTQNLFFVLSNGGAVSTTATITTPGSVDGLAIADATLTVAAGKIGLIPLSMLFRGATNRATVNYSATATVTAGVVKLGF